MESFKDFAQFSVLDPCHNAPEFGSILSGGRKPEKLRTYEGREFLTSHSISILRRKTFNFMLQTTNQRQV